MEKDYYTEWKTIYEQQTTLNLDMLKNLSVIVDGQPVELDVQKIKDFLLQFKKETK